MILQEYIRCNKGENKVAFVDKVKLICQKLQINPNWLMVVMFHESGLNAQAVNKQKGDSADPYTRAASRATGLIQFMPSTARGMGTTTQALYKMTSLQQLDYVYAYFRPFSGKLKSYYDLYMVAFAPIAIGRPDDFVIQTKRLSASAIARSNPALDLNKDFKITVGEAKKVMYNIIPKQYLNDVLSDSEKKSPSSDC
ncbi:MAG: transglycosylase SLT domain-containing protein [Bacteroidota bacterium]